MPQSQPVAARLAARAVEARATPLPRPVLDAAIAVLVDWCGVTIGGSRTEAARALSRALSGEGPCQVVGTARGAEPPTAALLNGVAAHVLELDDIYAPGLYHPGAPTIAAALPAAQHAGVSGARLLRGIAVGFEIGNRVARTLGAAHYRHWHTTGTAGAVAAAAAVAEILDLDRDRFANALALATTMGAGLQQTFRTDSMGKPLHSGHAAQSGIVAGLAAAEGFTGTLDALDGEIGMSVVMGDSPSWSAAAEPFGDYLVRQTTVKPYSCCGHTFAAIDAALDLHAGGVVAEDLAAIEVQTYGAALAVAGNPAPTTPFEAKFSIPFVVATALRTGTLTSDAFDEFDSAEIRKTMAAVTLRDGAEFTEAFPARRGARVTAVEHTGRRHEVSVPDRRGDPANPLTPAQLDAKFTGLVAEVFGSARASAIAEDLRAIADLPDVRALRLTS
jgi:2-methylcitrate dehydratase PrpD